MIKEIEGIIVSTVDYKESSKIINILTKEDGLIGAFAKGSKKLKSKIRETSNIMTYGIFHIKKINNGMPNLIEVDIIDNFKNIRKDLLKTFIELTGNGFLYNMVRIICGTIVDVGLGKIAPEEIPGIIENCDRTKAGRTLPPQGLYLKEVKY